MIYQEIVSSTFNNVTSDQSIFLRFSKLFFCLFFLLRVLFFTECSSQHTNAPSLSPTCTNFFPNTRRGQLSETQKLNGRSSWKVLPWRIANGWVGKRNSVRRSTCRKKKTHFKLFRFLKQISEPLNISIFTVKIINENRLFQIENRIIKPVPYCFSQYRYSFNITLNITCNYTCD